MVEIFSEKTLYILYFISSICVLLFILLMIFSTFHLKKKKVLQKLLFEKAEYDTWRHLKEQELEAQKEMISVLMDEKLNLVKENEHLKSDMTAQSKYMKEQLEFLERNKDELSLKFKDISNEIIKAQNATFSESQKNALDLLLKPFQNQLLDFKKKMEESHDDNVKFDEQIKHLFDLNKNLSKEAENLATALKGNKKIQGNWGEFQLERVLEISGLQKGINYFTQETFKDDNDKMLRPDVIVQLPDERQVIIDSKVSLNDYVAYVNAEDEISRAEYLKKHVACIKKHIDELSSKEYQKLLKDKALDYVMIFIPIEGAYVDAAHADLSLYDYAVSRNIAITTPSSLLPLLRTVENLWQWDKRNKNASQLAEIGGKIYDKLAGFVSDMEQIDKSLHSAQMHYKDAITKLKGRGGALSFAEQLKEKGAKTTKQLALEIEDTKNITFEERVQNE